MYGMKRKQNKSEIKAPLKAEPCKTHPNNLQKGTVHGTVPFSSDPGFNTLTR